MKKAIGITVGVLVVILVLVITREEIHWLLASHKNETARYESYLKNWPAGRHRSKAKDRIESLHWQEAIAAKTVPGFDRYVQLHPDGKHVAEARNNIESLLESLYWKLATTAKTVSGYKRYVQLHPNGKHIAEAKDNIESLHWQKANIVNTIRAYQQYSTIHPEGRHMQEAQAKAATLRTDNAPFDAAMKVGTAASVRQFIRDFPGHRKQLEAQRTLKNLARAIAVLDTPDVMRKWRSMSCWRWDAVLKETGGNSGFRVKSTDFYILCPNGDRWTSYWSETCEVKAGGSVNIDYYMNTSPWWAGGKFHCVWVGKDDLGNQIRIVHEVKIPK